MLDMKVFFVCVLMVSFPWWQWRCPATAEPRKPKCTVAGATTSCVCEVPAPEGVTEKFTSTATLSETANVVSLDCAQSFSFVPSNVEKVCATTSDVSLKACKEDGKKRALVSSPISDFMTETPTLTSSVKWVHTDTRSSLAFPVTNFPFTDKSFIVGCIKSEDADSCILKVAVRARKSLLKENVLTCSYGAESNQPVPKTTLDSTNNSLTVVCGTDGTMPLTAGVPTIYLCKDPETDVCTTVEDVTEVFPGFSKAWWTKQDGQENAAKLTIPKDGFPVEPKTVMFGCSLQVQPPLRKMHRKRTGWMQLSFLHAR
ncbi:SAG-related sequence [Besnoitia besnoiti]|uniref:SAG-related sequence n=1 Tax=Besnoitia besnoiti TaxID=94643 RepID=A0A2A9MH27_BESBE|nr:SAG-related sequence [Besnoitia besnoiti]PFH35266.1 SAG-related sequence [Besnoitia besnoiti]